MNEKQQAHGLPESPLTSVGEATWRCGYTNHAATKAHHSYPSTENLGLVEIGAFRGSRTSAVSPQLVILGPAVL